MDPFNSTIIWDGGTIALSYYLGTTMLIGWLGSIMVITIFLSSKEIQSSYSNWFVVNVSCAELVETSLFIELFMNAHAGYYYTGEMSCQIGAVIRLFGSGTSLTMLAFVAFERYLFIVKNISITKKQAKTAIAFGWINGFFLSVLVKIAGEDYVIQSNDVYCFPDWSSQNRINIFLSITTIIIVLVAFSILAIGYERIIAKLVASSKELSDCLEQSIVGSPPLKECSDPATFVNQSQLNDTQTNVLTLKNENKTQKGELFSYFLFLNQLVFFLKGGLGVVCYCSVTF